MPAIFISHSSRDAKAARDMQTMLAKLGFDQVFLDFDKHSGIGAGESWEKRLHDELARCHAVILVLTPNWLESKWCFAELVQARSLGKVVLPVICAPLGEQRVLAEIQAVDLLDWNTEGLDRIAIKLRAITDKLARGFAFDPKRPPYPGIHAFEPEDAAIYFGRDEETRAVLERLEARRTSGGARLQMILGASGAGKSSLMKAGVLPQIARQRAHWRVLPLLRPEKTPLEAVAKTIAHQLGAPYDWRAWHTKLSAATAATDVENLLKDLRVGDARAATVLLPIDQFEEVFTVATAEERTAFLALLAAVFDPARDLPIMALATGRSDLLDGLIESGGVAYETLPLGPMPLERVPLLVEGPASVASIGIDIGLAERMTRDLERPDALPLLAYTLWLLHKTGATDRRLSLAEYDTLGDQERGLNPIQNSVHLAAERALQGLAPPATGAELGALREAFVFHLVRIRLDDDRNVRQPAKLADLPPESRRLVRALTESRLLVSREGTVEVAHEALFKAWPTLAKWLTEEHAFLADSERLRAALDVWSEAKNEQKPAARLRGLLLARAREWKTKHAAAFATGTLKPVGDFIALSAAAEDAEQARAAAQAARTRTIERRLFHGAIGAAAVFAAVALVAGWQFVEADQARFAAVTSEKTAEFQRQEAVAHRNTALLTQSRFLADLSEQHRTRYDATTAALLALEALADPRSEFVRPYAPEAERALSNAWREMHDLRISSATQAEHDLLHKEQFTEDFSRKLEFDDKFVGIVDKDGKRLVTFVDETESDWSSGVLSRDGRRAVTWSQNLLYLWDAERGVAVAKVVNRDVQTADFSPDGQRLVIGTREDAMVLDADGRKLFPLAVPSAWVGFVSFSPDGKQIAAASQEGTVHLFGSQEGREMAVLKAGATHVRFSADGNLLLGADNGSMMGGKKEVTLWDTRSGELVARIALGVTSFFPLVRVAFDKGDTEIMVLLDGIVARWRPESIAHPRKIPHEAFVQDAVFSPDGQMVATATMDGEVRLWNRETRTMVRAFKFGGLHSLHNVRFTPDGRHIVSEAVDAAAVHTVRLWNVQSGESLAEIKGAAGPRFSTDGSRLLMRAGRGARLWQGGKIVAEHAPKDPDPAVERAVFAADGKQVVLVMQDHTIMLWDPESGSVTLKSPSGLNWRAVSDLSQDARYVIVAARRDDGENAVHVLDIEQGKLLSTLRELDWPQGARFLPDGKHLVAFDSQGHGIWNTMTGERVKVLEGTQAYIITINPNGRRFVLSQSERAELWDVGSGKQVGSFSIEGQALKLVISPDGQQLLSATGVARLWHIPEWQEVLGNVRKTVMRCLTREQRRAAFLDERPPPWCIEMGKWPYEEVEWKDWLAASRVNSDAPMPE